MQKVDAQQTRCLLLRIDAVDGANHSLIEFLLKPPPLRFGSGMEEEGRTDLNMRRRIKMMKRLNGKSGYMCRGYKCGVAPFSPFSSLEVVLPHWNVLTQVSDHSRISDLNLCGSVCVCLKEK